MRNLHSIIITTAERYIWAYAYGRNGRIIGDPTQPNRWRDRALYHAYLIPRGTPPPQDGTAWRRENRRYWHPWNPTLSRDQIITPICGRLRTQSRNPVIQLAHVTPDRRCPNCETLMPSTTTLTWLRTTDPWELIPWGDRGTALDPISGL